MSSLSIFSLIFAIICLNFQAVLTVLNFRKKIYSEENDWNGCPHCCENNLNNSCGSWGKYRDSFGCEKCCHSFSEEECLRHETSFSGGCKMCCPSCQVNSTLKYDSGCFKCCSKIEQCEGGRF